ncbi:hypothetical protein [Burkholderia sp. Bp8986]|uniref:hypothetical protein n=1 Tax=Burkholderia sp. Bp8986 TaxID=2184550 RepID=UPI000F58FD1A|nr:hypothetical protein [Burkholderia sp. Bp8986]RQS44926.1 hypothetical protein DID99_33905 [Burkholderia sp. Bp8986]
MRETAIRARVEALRDQLRYLNEQLAHDQNSRSANMQRWREVSMRRIVLGKGRLDCVGEDLAAFNAYDAKMRGEIERNLAKIERLKREIESEIEALRKNRVGQEKLSVLIEEGHELKRR